MGFTVDGTKIFKRRMQGIVCLFVHIALESLLPFHGASVLEFTSVRLATVDFLFFEPLAYDTIDETGRKRVWIGAVRGCTVVSYFMALHLLAC